MPHGRHAPLSTALAARASPPGPRVAARPSWIGKAPGPPRGRPREQAAQRPGQQERAEQHRRKPRHPKGGSQGTRRNAGCAPEHAPAHAPRGRTPTGETEGQPRPVPEGSARRQPNNHQCTARTRTQSGVKDTLTPAAGLRHAPGVPEPPGAGPGTDRPPRRQESLQAAQPRH